MKYLFIIFALQLFSSCDELRNQIAPTAFANNNETFEAKSTIMITKLYKKIGSKIYYWEIWEEGESNKLVVHWGVLGDTGEASENIEKSKQTRQNVYERMVKEKRQEGYSEPASQQQMIIQFSTNDSWGDTNDLDFRNHMWDVLNDILGWTGNGAVHGGDIGSGTANLFFEVVDAGIAVQTIVTHLKAKEIKNDFKIALEIPSVKDGDFELKVLYPENYQGKFNY